MSDSVSDFGVLLSQLAGGSVRDELSDTVRDTLLQLEQRALATSKSAKGKITLELAIVVAPNGLATFDPNINSKVPDPIRQVDHFYVCKDGSLSRKNQKQQELAFVEVAQGTKDHVMEAIQRAREIKG